MATIICSDCGLPKDLEKDFELVHDKRWGDGYTFRRKYCKGCAKKKRAAWRKKNKIKLRGSANVWYHKNKKRLLADPVRREKKNEAQRKAYPKNKKKLIAYQKKRRKEKAPQIKATRQRYYQKNKKEIAAKRKDNAVQIKEMLDRWRKANEDHVRGYRKKYLSDNKTKLSEQRKKKFQKEVRDISGGYLKMLIRKKVFPPEVETDPALLERYKRGIVIKRLKQLIKKIDKEYGKGKPNDNGSQERTDGRDTHVEEGRTDDGAGGERR